jgi:hypothetical protein
LIDLNQDLCRREFAVLNKERGHGYTDEDKREKREEGVIGKRGRALLAIDQAISLNRSSKVLGEKSK